MRILLWGNPGNGCYQLGKILIKKGHLVSLYLMSFDKQRSNPFHIDREANDTWFYSYDNDSFWRKLYIKRELVNYVDKNFDVVITAGMALTNTYRFSIPVFVFPTGGELNSDPFFKRGHIYNFKALFLLLAHNYSLRKVKKIFATGAFTPDIKAYERLRHKGFVVTSWPVDSKDHHRLVDQELLADLEKKYEKYKMVVMWFTRLNSDPNAPSYKAPDKFFKVMFKLLEKKLNIKILYGRHGTHADEIEQQIVDSGFSEYFESLPHMEYWRLQTYYSLSNGVIVETMMNAGGNMSNVARDCLALGAPLVTNYNDDIYALYPEGWPILRINNSSDLEFQLEKVYGWTSNDRADYKLEVSRWFSHFMEAENVVVEIERALAYEALMHRFRSSLPFPLSLIGKNKAI